MSFAMVPSLTARWRELHKLQVRPPGGTPCIAILSMIALLALLVGIKLVSSSARVKLSLQKALEFVWDNRTHRSDPRESLAGTPGSDKNLGNISNEQVFTMDPYFGGKF